VWLAEVGRRKGGVTSNAGSIAVRWYSWVLAVAYISLGAYLLWAAPNLEALMAGNDLNNLELEVIGNVALPLLVLGVALIVAALVIGAAWYFGGNRTALFSIWGSHILVYIVILALVFPSFTPVKTYKPQSEWISAAIGNEPRFGMVDAAGVPRRGGFSYYTGTAVDLLDGPREAIEYLRKYPNTIVLVRSTQYERDFQAVEREAQLRILREIRVGSHLYVAVAAGTAIEHQ